MSRWPDDVFERISEACVAICTTHLALYGLLGLAGKAEGPGTAEELRDCAHGLIALGGDLTSLGVEIAQKAEKLVAESND